MHPVAIDLAAAAAGNLALFWGQLPRQLSLLNDLGPSEGTYKPQSRKDMMEMLVQSSSIER